MTEVIEQLQTAQQMTEEMFIDGEEEPIIPNQEEISCVNPAAFREEEEGKSEEHMMKCRKIMYDITYTLKNFANKNSSKKNKL
jgi:hypothetical protein